MELNKMKSRNANIRIKKEKIVFLWVKRVNYF